ncbi:conserved hypothetical protein [Mesorhizobium sp. ORS 3324]|nr:conserved hypothetical protein [Mesorhizobium sp. ORS 3324]
MDHYLDTELYNRLLDRVAGPHDPDAQGWTRRDEVMQALGDAGIWPSSILDDRPTANCLDLDHLASSAASVTAGDGGQVARGLSDAFTGGMPADAVPVTSRAVTGRMSDLPDVLAGFGLGGGAQ